MKKIKKFYMSLSIGLVLVLIACSVIGVYLYEKNRKNHKVGGEINWTSYSDYYNKYEFSVNLKNVEKTTVINSENPHYLKTNMSLQDLKTELKKEEGFSIEDVKIKENVLSFVVDDFRNAVIDGVLINITYTKEMSKDKQSEGNACFMIIEDSKTHHRYRIFNPEYLLDIGKRFFFPTIHKVKSQDKIDDNNYKINMDCDFKYAAKYYYGNDKVSVDFDKKTITTETKSKEKMFMQYNENENGDCWFDLNIAN